MLLNNIANGIRFAGNGLEDYKSGDPNFSTHTDIENQELNHESRFTSGCFAGGSPGIMLRIYKMLSIAV